MKTAKSADDDFLKGPDQAAEETGPSRSSLPSAAMKAYLRRRKQGEITDPEGRSSKRTKSKSRSTTKDH